MSYVPDLNAYGMLSDLGNKISAGVKEYQQKQLLSALGQDLLGGDYQSAAAKALQAGDMATGLKLMELGQQKQNAAALPSLLQGPSFGQQPANAAPTPSGDGSGGDYFGKLAQIESKGNPNAVSPTGAQGLFQFIPSTWKQYGGGADVRDPKAQFVAVQKFTADNRDALTQALGREPTAGELYLAHQQGAGGAIKLLSNPGATPAELGLARNVAVNGGNPNAPAAQFVQKWVSKFDGVGSPLAFGSRDQATAPSAVAYARPPAPAASEDDGEEDKPAAGAQVAQGTVPAVPTPAKSTKSDDGENAAKIAALRGYQSRLTMGLATATGENAKAAITARLQQVKDQLAELKPDKEKFQIIKNEDGSITAINKSDPTQIQNIQTGAPAKSKAEYDTRKVLADDMGLSGSARTTFLANGKLPDQARVLRPGDQLVDPTGQVTAKNDGSGKTNNPRSAIGMYMLKYMEENPNATADDVQRAAQRFQAGGVGLNRFTSGPQGNTVRSFNVLVHHLGTLGDAADALGNGNIKVFNSLAQNYATQTGQPAPTNFEATKQLVGDEIVKAVVGAAGALGDREEAKKTLDKANSPAQLRGVIEQYKKLAAGQLLGLRYQYQSSTGRSEDEFNKMLMPNTAKFLGISAGHGSSESSGDGGSKAAAPTNSRTTKFGVKWSVE